MEFASSLMQPVQTRWSVSRIATAAAAAAAAAVERTIMMEMMKARAKLTSFNATDRLALLGVRWKGSRGSWQTPRRRCIVTSMSKRWWPCREDAGG